MKNRKLEVLVGIVIFIVLLNLTLVMNYSLISSHERSHEEVNNIFGCDSIIEINLMSGNTKTINCKLNEAQKLSLQISQSNVESTYVLMTFSRFVIVMFLLIIGVLFQRKIMDRLKNDKTK